MSAWGYGRVSSNQPYSGHRKSNEAGAFKKCLKADKRSAACLYWFGVLRRDYADVKGNI